MRRQKKAAKKVVQVFVDLTGDSSDDEEEKNNENVLLNPQEAVELPVIKIETNLKVPAAVLEEPKRIANRAPIFPLPVNLPLANDARWNCFLP